MAQPSRKLTIAEMPEEVQATYRDEQQRKNEEARTNAFQQVADAVDNDVKKGIIKMRVGDDRISVVADITQREVWRRVALGEPFGSALVADVLQSYTRPTVEKLFRTGGGPSDQDYPSVGPVGEMSPASLQTQEPPQRVPHGHPDRLKYVQSQMR